MTAVPSTFIAASQYCNKQIEARMADMSVVQIELAKTIIEVQGRIQEIWKGGSFTGAVTPSFRPSPVLGLTHCEAAHWFPLQIPGDIV